MKFAVSPKYKGYYPNLIPNSTTQTSSAKPKIFCHFMFHSCQCNNKVGYYPWNLCERMKFWKRILRNRALSTKIMSILGGGLHKGEKIISLRIVFVLRNTNSGPIGLKVLNNTSNEY